MFWPGLLCSSGAPETLQQQRGSVGWHYSSSGAPLHVYSCKRWDAALGRHRGAVEAQHLILRTEGWKTGAVTWESGEWTRFCFQKNTGFFTQFSSTKCLFFLLFNLYNFLGLLVPLTLSVYKGWTIQQAIATNCRIQCKPKENWCENIFSMFAHEAYRHESKKPKQIKDTCYREQKSLTTVSILPRQKTLHNCL